MAEDLSFRVKNTLVVNSAFVANSTVVNAAAITSTSLVTGTANTTAINIGANVNLITTQLRVGNATAQVIVSNSGININGTSINNTTYEGTANNASNLGGQLPAFYTNATNLSTGTVPAARLSGSYTITASNATNLNNQLASFYTDIPARLGFTPVNRAGDTMTGTLSVPYLNVSAQGGSEGGELQLEKPPTGSSLNGSHVSIDVNANSLRIFENGSPFRGVTLNLTGCASQSILLHSTNFNSYSPTLTGGNASGTWNINITGNAATATNATAAADSVRLNGQTSDFYTNIPARLGYTPANRAGDTFTGAVQVNSWLGASSYMTAPIYYDSADVSWYVDPNSTSRIVALQHSVGNWMTSTDGRLRMLFNNLDWTTYRGGATNQWAHGFQTSDGTTRWLMEGTGAFYATNNIVAYWSDRRLKKNIQKIADWKNIINGLNGYRFEWNEAGKKILADSQSGPQIGFIAQEVKEVLPQAAPIQKLQYDYVDGKEVPKEGIDHDPNDPYLTVQTDKIVPVLVEAIKGLMSEVEELKAQIQQLKR